MLATGRKTSNKRNIVNIGHLKNTLVASSQRYNVIGIQTRAPLLVDPEFVFMMWRGLQDAG